MLSFPFKYSRVGGMRFLRIGNLQVSWCITRTECKLARVSFGHMACLGLVLGAGLAVALG